ncbi:MAG TPA: ATP-binding protein, partial [Chitinophagaceae bacterium]
IMKEINPTGKLHISFVQEGMTDEKTIAPSIQLAVFRIIQEQLTNIIKHSGATQAALKLIQDNKTLQLEIRDNGSGFDIHNTPKGLGLHNIFTRAELCSGKAMLETKPGKGCLLKIILPVEVE